MTKQEEFVSHCTINVSIKVTTLLAVANESNASVFFYFLWNILDRHNTSAEICSALHCKNNIKGAWQIAVEIALLLCYIFYTHWHIF